MPDTAPDDAQLQHDAQQILHRHDGGSTESEIGAAIRDFLIESGLARADEIEQEQPPAPDAAGFVDLRTPDVIIEFKRRIGTRLEPTAAHVQQLDQYLEAAVNSHQTQRLGLLTDGKYWLLRTPGMGPVNTQSPNAFTLGSVEEQGLLLYEWLRDQSQALEARDVPPTEAEVRNRLGAGPRFETHLRELRTLYDNHRHDPTITIKRELWRRLLAAALGEVVDDTPDLDELFVRHTYLSAVVGLAVQAAFGINLDTESHNAPDALLNGQTFANKTGLRGVVESDFFTWPIEVAGADWLRNLARRVGRFDWTQAQSDIARILYEAVIPADDRRRLG